MSEILHLPIASIVPDPDQPRKTFDDTTLAELAATMATVGVIQPITVKPFVGTDGKVDKRRWMLVAGERRLRAAGIAKLETIPCIVGAPKDGKGPLVQLIENVQREDLTPLELARSLKALTETGHKQKELATALGLAPGVVSDHIRILALSGEILGMVGDGRITFTGARALLGEKDEAKRMGYAKQLADGTLTVNALEKAIAADKPDSGGGASGPKGATTRKPRAKGKFIPFGDLSQVLHLHNLKAHVVGEFVEGAEPVIVSFECPNRVELRNLMDWFRKALGVPGFPTDEANIADPFGTLRDPPPADDKQPPPEAAPRPKL